MHFYLQRIWEISLLHFQYISYIVLLLTVYECTKECNKNTHYDVKQLMQLYAKIWTMVDRLNSTYAYKVTQMYQHITNNNKSPLRTRKKHGIPLCVKCFYITKETKAVAILSRYFFIKSIVLYVRKHKCVSTILSSWKVSYRNT